MRYIFCSLIMSCLLLPACGQEPGYLNEEFLDTDINVSRFTNMFERETRDVSANRTAIVDVVNLKPGMVVADIGAGTGLFMSLFSQEVGAQGQYIGVEISMGFVEHLRQRADKEKLTNVTIVLSSLTSSTLPPNSVDVIFVCDTYHHFESPRSMLLSMKKALRSGGQLFIIDMYRNQSNLNHVRADQKLVQKEIEDVGFVFDKELKAGLDENYILRFKRP